MSTLLSTSLWTALIEATLHPTGIGYAVRFASIPTI